MDALHNQGFVFNGPVLFFIVVLIPIIVYATRDLIQSKQKDMLQAYLPPDACLTHGTCQFHDLNETLK